MPTDASLWLTIAHDYYDHDTEDRQGFVPWGEFVNHCGKHIPLVDKFKGTGFAFARFKPGACTCGVGPSTDADGYHVGCPDFRPGPAPRGHRTNRNVTSVTGLGLDLDKAEDGTPLDKAGAEAVLAGLRARGVEFIAYSSWSYDGAAKFCLRVIFPLSAEVPIADWSRFWPVAYKSLGVIKAGCVPCAQHFWFGPSCPPGGTPYFEHHRGAPLDVEAILAVAPVAAPHKPGNSDGLPDESTEPAWLQAIPAEKRLADLRVKLESEPGEVMGTRQATLWIVAPKNVFRYAARDADAVTDLLCEVWNPKNVPPYPREKIARAVSDACNAQDLPDWGEFYRPNPFADLVKAPAPPVPPNRNEVQGHYRGTTKKLGRRTGTQDLVDHELLGRIFGRSSGTLVRGTETADEALADVVAALVRRAPPGATDVQIAEQVARFTADTNIAIEAVARARTTNSPIADEVRPASGNSVAQAEAFVAAWATHPDGATLRRWRGAWYRWDSGQGHYREVTAETLEKHLYQVLGLDDRNDVGDARHALIAVDDVLIDEVELGEWIDGNTEKHPCDVAACANGLLHLPTLELIPATPKYFATTALGVGYDPDAPTPTRWLKFLGDLWPKDPQSITALQEWFGYTLTPDTRQQKILMLVGPPRSGKGTIMRVLTDLLGAESVCAPTIAALGTNFGPACLIGRSLATVNDARLDGRADVAQIVERLLSYSGEDQSSIDRKHRETWTGRLSTRFALVSNVLPRFADPSGALASRFLLLQTECSWLGKEDTSLTADLLAELPGILRWAIDGWCSLRARGHFEQPASSADAIDELADLASPVAAWMRERCIVGPGEIVSTKDAYADFRGWCADEGNMRVPTLQVFGCDLKAATGCRKIAGPRDSSGKRTPTYVGIGLRSGATAVSAAASLTALGVPAPA